MIRPALLALSLALTFATPAAADVPPPPPSPVTTAPPATETKLDAAGLVAAADEITRQVVALRGLKDLRRVPKGVLSRTAIGAKLRERIAKEYTPEEIRVESRLLKRLGLLPLDADYEKTIVDLLMDQVAGFYDPFARQLYIADWLGMELQRPAMAHEIGHALQDQHFNLKLFATPLKEEGDRQLARAALVEGDGTSLMIDFIAQSMALDVDRLPGAIEALGDQIADSAMTSSPEFARAPRFLRETLLFPYLGGMKFVMALRKAGGWRRVDAAFKSPPDSSEQVLHPAKFLTREAPVVITAAPIAVLAPAKELRRDVLGELGWRALLASRLPDAVAERAAAGWGGDRLVVYGADRGPVAIVSLSAWDSEEDALEADSALRKLLPLLAGAVEKPVDQPARYQTGADEVWAMERRGRQLLALFGVPASASAAISDETWKLWKIKLPPPPMAAKPARRPGKAK